MKIVIETIPQEPEYDRWDIPDISEQVLMVSELIRKGYTHGLLNNGYWIMETDDDSED